MVSRAWPSLIRIPLVVLMIVTDVGWITIPVQAESGGVCQTAYGLIPTSVPDWLMPAEPNMDLATANRYDYLSAKLLSAGFVDGSTCPAFGLNLDGSANGCGVEFASDRVATWQNQFDPVILAYSQANKLPPKVVKAVIAVESQFWPAGDRIKGEVGLGQMTENGADLVLRWRPDYYQSICRLTFGEKGCDVAYSFLDASTQRLLQGMVLKEIDASDSYSSGGINIEKADQSISVLTETLNASCLQSARIIELATGKSPASLMSYEDYWRFVLANYHAGASCMYQALKKQTIPVNGIASQAIFPVDAPVVQNISVELKHRSSHREGNLMNWIILGLVLLWLAIISWFDIRKNEIPHSLWVIIPLIGACFYRTWQGDCSLVFLTILIVAISERGRISQLFTWKEIGKMITWFPVLFIGVYLSVQGSPFAALAIIGFWAAWELKWWGGADAVAAMTIILIYPEESFFLSFLAVHIFVSVGLLIISLIREKKNKIHKIPSLPLLWAAVFIFQFMNIIF